MNAKMRGEEGEDGENIPEPLTENALKHELEESQDRYRTLFNTMTDGFALHEIICDENGEPYDYRFLEVNPAFENLMGMKRGDVLGKTYRELLPNYDPLWIKACGRVALTGETKKLENYSPDLKRHYDVTAYRPAHGQFAAIFIDTSDRKRIKEAPLESDRRFRFVVDSIPFYVMVYDRELRFRFANRAMVEMMGLSEEMIFGHTNEELFCPVIIKPYIDHLRKALETRSVQKAEYTHDLPSGSMTFFTIYVPLTDESGDVIQILGISQDITEIREAEETLKRALEENRKQNRLLKTVVEELKGNYDEIEDLLHKISHDLIVPLITIEGFLGLLKKDVQVCNRIRIEIDLGLIGDAVSRMKRLLGDALELSSLGILTKPAEKIPFEEIIKEVGEHFENIGTSIDLVITEDKKFPPVYINRNRMVDVLISMIDSCIRCSGQGRSSQPPRVHVGWHNQDDGPVFFTRCEWAEEAKDLSQAMKTCCGEDNAGNSTSIGLALSKRIIELQGGSMWTECGTGEGCIIFFNLPEKEDK